MGDPGVMGSVSTAEGGSTAGYASTSGPDLGDARSPVGVRIALVLAALALVVVPLILSRLVGQPDGERHVFEIPAGTADRLAAGEQIEVIPADLDLKLSDLLVLVNRDDQAHQVGTLKVAAGETIERRFSQAASVGGYCSLHSNSRISIDIG